jgi:hypothetical protein
MHLDGVGFPGRLPSSPVADALHRCPNVQQWRDADRGAYRRPSWPRLMRPNAAPCRTRLVIGRLTPLDGRRTIWDPWGPQGRGWTPAGPLSLKTHYAAGSRARGARGLLAVSKPLSRNSQNAMVAIRLNSQAESGGAGFQSRKRRPHKPQAPKATSGPAGSP